MPTARKTLNRTAATFLFAVISVLINSANAQTLGTPYATLDVGASNDDTATDIRIDTSSSTGLGTRQSDSGQYYRTLDEGGTLVFLVDASEVALSTNGVPHQHAIIEIEYDNSSLEDEDCTLSTGCSYARRPRLDTNLVDGERIFRLGSFGGEYAYDGDPATDSDDDPDQDGRITARMLIEDTPWQKMRAIDGLFEFRIFNPPANSDYCGCGADVPIDTISLYFVDDYTFRQAQETRWWWSGDTRFEGIAANGYRERLYKEDNSVANLSVYQQDDFVLFARHHLQKIYPNTVPVAAEIAELNSNGLSISEIAGESEPTTFSIFAFADIIDVAVEAGALTGTLGLGTIPAANIQVNLVEIGDKIWKAGEGVKFYGQNPWYLSDNTPFDVSSNGSKQVWLTVDVPDDTPPGVYTGTVTVSATVPGPTLVEKSVDLRVDVRSIALGRPDATSHIWWSPFAPYSATCLPDYLNEAALDDMAAHGVVPTMWGKALDLSSFTPGDDCSLIDINTTALQEEIDALRLHGVIPPLGVAEELRTEMLVYITPGTQARQLWSDFYGTSFLSEDQCKDDGCVSFDDCYVECLANYKEYFESQEIEAYFSFVDEPNTDVARRRQAHHLNRLAKEAGCLTYSTFSTSAERPILEGSHAMEFEDLHGGTSVSSLVGVVGTNGLVGYWDFSEVDSNGLIPDLSGNGNHGSPIGGAGVSNGTLVAGSNGYMEVADNNDTLDLTDGATISFWIKPTHDFKNYRYIIRKGQNFGMWYSNTAKKLEWYALAGDRWETVSKSRPIDFAADAEDVWSHILWVYDADKGGTLYVNGVAAGPLGGYSLGTNDSSLVIGNLPGRIDELGIYNRALTDDEVTNLLTSISSSGFEQQEATLSVDVSAGTNGLPETLTFTIGDLNTLDEELESTISLFVNSTGVWSNANGADVLPAVTINLPQDQFGDNDDDNITFRIRNGHSREETIYIYFHEDYWRNETWTAVTSDNWTYSGGSDLTGDLAPMDSYIDRRYYPSVYLTQDAIDRTDESTAELAYYATYPATQPVPANNRFLNGIYASATETQSVVAYAHAHWGVNPFNDMAGGTTSPEGILYDHVVYTLVLPTWEGVIQGTSGRTYPTIAYESLREGVEDSRLLYLLKSIIEIHPDRYSPQTVAYQADAFLVELFSRPERDYWNNYFLCDVEDSRRLADCDGCQDARTACNANCGTDECKDQCKVESYECNFSCEHEYAASYADRSAYMIGHLCVDTNGILDESICDSELDYAVFDNIREKVVEYILKLSDSDEDGIEDWYDNCPNHANAYQEDCNSNGIGNVCEIAYGFQPDCNSNGIPDDCEIALGTSPDCNTNGIPDDCEISADGNLDRDHNGVLDECEPPILFSATSRKIHGGYFDIRSYGSAPNNAQAVECRQGGITYVTFLFRKRPHNLEGGTTFQPSDVVVSSGTVTTVWVQQWEAYWLFRVAINGTTDAEPWTCSFSIQDEDGRQGYYADCWGVLLGDVDRDGELTTSDYDLLVAHDGVAISSTNFYYDLDADGVIETGTGEDDLLLFQANLGSGPLDPGCGPDDCETAIMPGPDCNTNGYRDECDIRRGTSQDCNTNGIPDECDLSFYTSTDCNDNNVPDECEVGGLSDCNSNLVADLCDIYFATSEDSNSNGVPDECEPARPVMTEALSLKGHGSPATVYSIAAENTECRNGGISQVKFSFDKIAYSTDGNDFVAGDFTLSRGTITNVATTWDDSVRPTTAEIILDISGVTTIGQLTISFSAENSVGLEQYYEACWTYVPADVDNDGDVDDDDETEIINNDQGVLSSGYRCDLDLDGVVEGGTKSSDDVDIWFYSGPIAPQTLCGD